MKGYSIKAGDTTIFLDFGSDPMPDSAAVCPVHAALMWWDGGEPGWYCAACGGWRDMGEETRMVRPGYWLPVDKPAAPGRDGEGGQTT